jgi:hypothetical protein
MTSFCERPLSPPLLSYFQRHLLGTIFTVDGGRQFLAIHFQQIQKAPGSRVGDFLRRASIFLMGPPCARHWVPRQWLGFGELPFL